MRTAVFAALLLAASTAGAQGVDRRYAEEPTEGIALPLTPLAGEHDARAVSVNPGGLALLRGTEVARVLGTEDDEVATSTGPGFGAFLGGALGGKLLPRIAFGLGFEWLRPPRTQLAPDPGDPFRFTFALATALGKNAGFGVAWRHFTSEGILDGADAFDLGLSTRFGNRLAIGAALRDITTTSIGMVPVQRKYELELVTRPLGHDALEVAVGGRLGETRLDTDGWARISARITRGFVAHVGVESRALHAISETPTGRIEDETRDVRGLVGLELSLGGTGFTAIGSGLRDDRGDNHLLGGQLVVRMSSVPPPSVLPRVEHLERVELSGAIGLRETTSLVARLRAIGRDSTVKGLVVTFDGVSAGWATLEELRNEILAVKATGKHVFAYMVSGTGRDYFVATAAHKIYIDPAGGLRLVGLAGSTMYFRGAFDQLGVVPQFERIAEYKSAPESFTQTGPSETAARMNEEIYDSLWERWVAAVAEGRKLTPAQVQAIVDNGPYTAGDLANDTKLVDAVGAPDKVAQLVAAEMKGVYPVARPPVERPERWSRPAIAVIYVDGDIIDGASRTVPLLGNRMAGSETITAAITAARANPKVGAIILRIDSPGGSAQASELISREVFATRGVKPILCSLSDVAASGGYFIAAGCDRIWAPSMALTGSIGIFYGKFDVSGLAARLGITTRITKRGQRADVESLFRQYTDEERVVLADKLRYMYGRFIGAVAEGRGMKKDEVDAVGRGHVYTAAQAQPLRLVDELGGFADALDYAKAKMGLARDTKVQLIELPNVPASLLATVLGLVGGGAQAQAEAPLSLTELPVIRELLRGVPASVLMSPGAPQARLPYSISVE